LKLLLVRKFDAAGNVQWTRQFGTEDPGESLRGGAVTSSGDLFVVGGTAGTLGDSNLGYRDVFVRKYDSSGNLAWTRQFGSESDEFAADISADLLGNVYITGATSGAVSGTNAGIYDAFIAKYDNAGNPQWTRQFGTDRADYAQGVAVDLQGNVYASGNTNGSLFADKLGFADAFLAKYTPDGDILWAHQFGTAAIESALSVNADGLGNAFIVGYTSGVLEGVNSGDADAYVRKYGPSGDLLWTQQLGTQASDWLIDAASFASDGQGTYFSAGTTSGSLAGPIAGGIDVFLVKFSDIVPEPGCLRLALPGLFIFGVMVARRVR
jgi:hypothetical protein